MVKTEFACKRQGHCMKRIIFIWKRKNSFTEISEFLTFSPPLPPLPPFFFFAFPSPIRFSKKE